LNGTQPRSRLGDRLSGAGATAGIDPIAAKSFGRLPVEASTRLIRLASGVLFR
jgi:hypothetical protein